MGDADSGRASPAAAPDDGSGPAAVDSEAAGPQHAALPPRRQKRSLSPDAEEKESMSDSSDDMDPREDEEQDDDDFEDGHRGKSVTGRAVAKAMDIRSLATEMGAMRKRACQYCQKRRIRCSGEYPCERCRLRRRECTYGPGKQRQSKLAMAMASNAKKSKARDSRGFAGQRTSQTSPQGYDSTFSSPLSSSSSTFGQDKFGADAPRYDGVDSRRRHSYDGRSATRSRPTKDSASGWAAGASSPMFRPSSAAEPSQSRQPSAGVPTAPPASTYSAYPPGPQHYPPYPPPSAYYPGYRPPPPGYPPYYPPYYAYPPGPPLSGHEYGPYGSYPPPPPGYYGPPGAGQPGAAAYYAGPNAPPYGSAPPSWPSPRYPPSNSGPYPYARPLGDYNAPYPGAPTRPPGYPASAQPQTGQPPELPPITSLFPPVSPDQPPTEPPTKKEGPE